MKIIKAKITKDSTLVATYKDENGTTTVEGKNLVTSDLINAFSKLNPHAALLTEQKEVDGIESVDEVPDIIGQYRMTLKTFINNYSSNPLYYFTFVLG